MRALFSHPADRRMLRDMLARNVTVTVFDRVYFRDLVFEDGAWVEYESPVAGSTNRDSIDLVRDGDAVAGAITIVHENVHTRQPDEMGTLEAEMEAYTAEEEWAISHGIPAVDDACRMRDSDGREVPNPDGIRRRIYRDYPGLLAPPSAGGAGEEIVAVDDTYVIVRDANRDDHRRPAQEGDTFGGEQVAEPPDGVSLDLRRLL